LTGIDVPPFPFAQRLDDLLAVRALLPRAFGGWRLLTGVRGTTGLAVTHIDVGPFSASDATLPGDLTFAVGGRSAVTVGVLAEGTAETSLGASAGRYRAGEVFLASYPQADFVCHTRDARLRVLTLPADLVAEVAGTGPLRFSSARPASPARQDHWLLTASFVADLLANAEAVTNPPVMDGLARLLAVTVLSVFGVTVVPAQGQAEAASPALRRAVRFIDAHAHADISVADIAAAAHVTTRAIQFAFRRHLDSTPTAYLRQIRLSRAHAELLAARPGDGPTVTAVAARWGFPSASRFTASYRAVYGVSPSQTLRGETRAR
jgi:AraC-like DNA-binding protein